MINMSWETLLALLGMIGTLLIVAWKGGGLASRVSRNEADIRVMYNKLDDIWHFIRNGERPT